MPRAWARSERGLAVPIVLMIIVVGLALAGAAVTASISAQRGSVRDEASKDALAAADAGAELALFRQNKVVTTEGLPCVIPTLGGDLVAGLPLFDSWCPQFGPVEVGDGSFRYRVKPWSLTGARQNQRELQIVAVGTANGVSRRIDVTARAVTGAAIFGDNQIVGLDELTVGSPGSLEEPSVIGNAASNGDVTLNSSAVMCGDVTYGPGHDLVLEGSSLWCPGWSKQAGTTDFPPVDQGSVSPVDGGANDNARFFTEDVRTPPSGNSVQWDPVTRVLQLHGNGTVTLGGTNYSFCRLVMDGNSTLIAARGAAPRIYFDSPENCRATGDPVAIDATDSTPFPYVQLSVTGNAKVIATSGDAKDFAFMFVGSDQYDTQVNMTGDATVPNEVFIYAPRSAVTLGGSSILIGAMVGETTLVTGSANFISAPDPSDFDASTLLRYKRVRYVECSGGAMPSTPNASC
jgi:hypothetical protein